MCPAFFSFDTMLFIVKLLIKMDSTVICVLCVPCIFEHVLYEPFPLKLQIWKISYVNWLNLVYWLKFTPLRPDLKGNSGLSTSWAQTKEHEK